MKTSSIIQTAAFRRNPPLPNLPSADVLTEGRVLITPGMAQMLLDKFNYRRQRRLEPLHIKKLAIEMQAGVWVPGSQIAFGVMPDQTVQLVNGQHRLHAIIDSGREIEFQILLVPVANDDELHALYRRFDTVQRSRSDAMVMDSTGIAEKLGIHRTTAVKAYTAGMLIATDLQWIPGALRDPTLGTPDGKLAAVAPWWPYVKQYDDLISRASGDILRRLRNPSVMAVALVTLAHQPELAATFWGDVAANDGLRATDARHAFVTALLTKSFRGSQSDMTKLTVSAWNAFFEGRKVIYFKPATTLNTRVLGTPYGKRQRSA